MRLPRDILSGTYTKPRLFLCETNKERICQLDTTNTNGSFKFNAMSELSFETARVYNDPISGKTKVNPFYDKIEALRLVYVEDFGYFELQGPELISDGIKESKSCTAYSLEYTLSQKYLDDFYINMGTVESLEVINATSEENIIPIMLYNPSNPKLSLLHLALSETYGWSVGHVDTSLQTLSRQFEIDRESVYDFLINDVCEKFNCYIVFDTINNTINVYAESLTAKFIADGNTDTFTISPPFIQIGTVSVDGYKTTKWIYNEKTGALTLEDVPESGSHIEVVDGALTEWETDVFVSFENLAQEVNINYDADSIKTKLTVTYGDDYDIREVNLGLPYLTDISYYYTVDWMGQDLYDAYTKYMQKSNSLQAEYSKNSQEILMWNDYIAYEENRLSLEYSLVESVNSSTVGTYYTRHQNLDGSYYYSEVSLPAEYMVDVDYYSNLTTNVDETKVNNLYDVLKQYFYAYFNNNTEDIEKVLDDLTTLEGFDFLTDYKLIDLRDDLKMAAEANKDAKDKQEDMDVAIYKFLNQLWPELGRKPLQELYLKPYKTIQEQGVEAGWSNVQNSNYGNYYPVVLYISSIESAIAQRTKVIDEYKAEQKTYQDANSAIGDSLLMRNNFTEAQLIRLSAFLREDELHIDDIVETDLDDVSSSFKIKQDAMESGRIELQKLCQPQLQFSMTMANIYALPEFSPIIHQFQLGRVIRVCLRPDYIKQSRLLQVDINFDDFSDFSCEFGELTSLRTQSDIHADLLSKAITAGKSVATNSSYWTRGSDTATSVDLKIQQGLLDATTQIKAMDANQGVIIDRYGIHLQEVNPTTGEIDPKQGWIINNKFLYSDDGFKSTKSVFGEYEYDNQTYYGILAEALVGKLLIGSQIKLENSSGTMTFDDNGFSVKNESNSFELNPNSKNLLKISNQTTDILYVNDDGDLNITGTITATAGSIGGCEITDGKLQVPAANITGTLVIGQLPDSVAKTEDIPTDVSQLNNDSGYQDYNGVVTITNGTVTADYIKTLDLQVGNQISMGPNATISWSNVTDTSDVATKSYVTGQGYQTSSQVTQITKDTVTTSYVNALGVKAGSVDAENITGTTITGKTISGGTISGAIINNGSGTFYVDSDGNLSATKANIIGTITASEGSIGSWTIGRVRSSRTNTGLFYSGAIDGAGIGFLGHCSTDSPAIWAGYSGGTSTPYDYEDSHSTGSWADHTKFYVTRSGILKADGAIITGTITSSTISGSTINNGNGTFYVDPNGAVTAKSLTATNASISGVLTAGVGSSLGGFAVDSNSIYKGSWGSSPPSVFMSTGTSGTYTIGGKSVSGWAFGAGGKFGVTNSGALYCTSGKLGGWEIQTGYITSTQNVVIKTLGTQTWSQKVYLKPDGIEVQVNYVSGNPKPSVTSYDYTVTWYDLVTSVIL